MLSSQHCQQEILGAPIQDGLVRFRNRNDSRRFRQQGWQGVYSKDFRLEKLEAYQQRGFQSGRDAIRFRTLVGGHGNRRPLTMESSRRRGRANAGGGVFDSGTASATVDV